METLAEGRVREMPAAFERTNANCNLVWPIAAVDCTRIGCTRLQSGHRSMSNDSVRRAAPSASCRGIEWLETISTYHSPLRSGNIQRPSGGTFFQTHRQTGLSRRAEISIQPSVIADESRNSA